MNRRNCINCQTTWSSLADNELEAPHMCPRCGDQLAPVATTHTDTNSPASPVSVAR